MRSIKLAAAALLVAPLAPVAANPVEVGTYSLLSLRRCGTADTRVACLGSGSSTTTNRQVGPAIFLNDDGPGRAEVDSSYSGEAGASRVAISFRSDLRLPLVRLLSAASARGGTYTGEPPRDNGRQWEGWRLGANAVGLQSYTYVGAAPTPFALEAELDFMSTGWAADIEGVVSGESPGASTIFANLWILDAVDFSSLAVLEDAVNLVTGDCSRIRGLVQITPTGSAGYQVISGATRTTTCVGGVFGFSDDPLMLTPGQEITVLAQLGAFSNRGGMIDATNTLVVRLDPALPAEARAAVRGSLIAAVPAPAGIGAFVAGLAALAWHRARRG